MSNKIVLLTTDTPHHLNFAWKLMERHPLAGILLETNCLKAPFETFHPMEKQRDDFERQTLLAGAPKNFNALADTRNVPGCNEQAGLAELKRWSPDWLIVFGTGLLKSPVLNTAKIGCLNLHGGDPEHYRGLDSHYWTVYHRDFEHLVTTLHLMEEKLDTGDIVGQQKLPLKRGMELFQLRAVNTQACIDLTVAALDSIAKGGPLKTRRQKMKGRYYSFMPAALKQVCVDNFKKHVSTL